MDKSLKDWDGVCSACGEVDKCNWCGGVLLDRACRYDDYDGYCSKQCRTVGETTIHCHLCDHDWNYTGHSKARYITCPSCYGKVPNPNFKRLGESNH